MARLAIKGHATRGSEVIALLEMLGGKNIHNYNGTFNECYVIDNNKICTIYTSVAQIDGFVIITLEEFLEKFPYKVGDGVIAYVEGCLAHFTIKDMRWNYELNKVEYKICSSWCDTSLIQPYKEETMEDKSNLLQQLKDYFENTPREIVEKEWHEYDKYNEISPKVNEYLEYVNNIRQPQYPKTYKECCEVLGLNTMGNDAQGYEADLIICFQELLIARDAYWEIAGVQMGLGKPWEPDYTDKSYEQGSPIKYVIYYTGTHITKGQKCTPSYILTFPTAEMRDAFYENFKDLIETVKELL